ncbi:HNH endonuclease signature motif containing protein [Cupriavidus sp. AcVe19-1a]|uniref:HNH endonuclease signature motif containing protein n=1 Tax=Cupriavidus sp. AcVe19-1a TaxID=2821359 RepID=UPI001AE901E3|nr:HNH endonuclease signature motif containing protein [Cupriavidus sp. AcVe19-1a]MBP0629920.1 HNH endonuclease [Cupriavidus sp. AcVe19-1a]
MEEGWSDAELEASVNAYKRMARAAAAGERINKSGIYRELETRYGRAAGAFERRMQNISAVLQDLGSDWVPGLKPLKNVGPNVRPRIEALLGTFRIPKLSATNEPSSRVAPPVYSPELSALRNWLIALARHGKTVTPADTMDAFGIDEAELYKAIRDLGQQSKVRGEPILPALIVNPEGGGCPIDLSAAFGVESEDGERLRLFAFSGRSEPREASEPEPEVRGLKPRAAQFASVEIRPDQAAFRRRVFLACEGKCVVSGCDVVRALDAAHLRGRDWRKGHNAATDGALLRKDLHALYDGRLLWFSDDGRVGLHSTVRDYYLDYEGAKARLPEE